MDIDAPSRVLEVPDREGSMVLAEAGRIADAFMWRVEWQRPGDGASPGRAKVTLVAEVDWRPGGVDPAVLEQAIAEMRTAATVLRDLDARMPTT